MTLVVSDLTGSDLTMDRDVVKNFDSQYFVP